MDTLPHTPTILVVDDSPENIDMLVGILGGAYKVKAAKNGEKALKIARSQTPPDLILLDIIMPEMDGYDVCRQLKSDPSTMNIPVMFVTGKDRAEDETRGLQLGAVDYITKPFTPPIVLARVKTHLALYFASQGTQPDTGDGQKPEEPHPGFREAENEPQQAPLRQTILVLDDSPESIDVLVSILSPYYKVKATTQGQKALKIATSSHPPDLILMDIVMPDMDGYAVCRQLKADRATCDIPVLFISVLEETLDKVKAFGIGGVDYITKPFQAEEVVARVKTHLSLRNMQKQVQQRSAELEKTNTRLQHSLETLQIAQEQLVHAEKMAALGRLVAGVAHEINTPIGIGVTAASYLEHKTTDLETLYKEGKMTRSELEQYISAAKESSDIVLKNLRRAAEQIQSFKQVAVDQTRSDMRAFRLKTYIDDLLLSLHPKLSETHHKIIVQCPEELEVFSYPGAFSQILTNLILNSLIHGFEKQAHGEIILNVSTDSNSLWLEYKDNGKGIVHEERRHVFEPFYTTKRGTGSTGLGLHIVYNLVTQQLGGNIECESKPGEGTTFVIQVPLVENVNED